MDNRTVDLHVHSNASDGSFTPEELVREALTRNLSAMAVTDHDTIDGIARAREAAKGTSLEIISGIELSCYNDNHEIHMVGLFLDEQNLTFQKHLIEFQDSRSVRNKKIIAKLQDAGFGISMDALRTYFPDCVLTRAHIARYLVEKGYIKDISVAFQKYIGDHCPYYVPREKITPIQAIDLIREAGGIAILAHPLLYHLSAAHLKELVISLKAHGLTGIEAIYATYTTGEEQEMKRLARETGLLISGGSDFHGANKPSIKLGVGRGHLYLPYSVLENLKAAAESSPA